MTKTVKQMADDKRTGDRLLQDAKKKQALVNELLQEKAKDYKLGVKGVSKERLEGLRNDLPAFSKMAQLEYVEHARRKLEKSGVLHIDIINNQFSRLFDISTATLKRYIKTATTKGGPLTRAGDMIMISSNYIEPDKDDYWWDDVDDENDKPDFLEGRA